jgi:hypothetical protein
MAVKSSGNDCLKKSSAIAPYPIKNEGYKLISGLISIQIRKFANCFIDLASSGK